MLSDSSCKTPIVRHPQGLLSWLVTIASALVLWLLAYSHLQEFADLVVELLFLPHQTPLESAVYFFAYEVPKVFLLLVAVIFVVGLVQTYFSPERTRSILSGKRAGLGNIAAAGLGIVTPFCSCSAVPMFIGFLSAGVPLGITFSFLISAPMVNEIALVMLLGLFGWKIAGLYLLMGLCIAIISGVAIGHLQMDSYLEDWVQEIQNSQTAMDPGINVTLASRFESGWTHVREIVRKIWLYVLLGIAVGAGIHGYVPQDFMASFMGKTSWWAVPLAVAMGVPMYSNAAGIIPIVEALLSKGAALGTVLAFMMAVISLSLPELIILRKALKLQLIATFAGIVTIGILLVGYVFNYML